MHVVCLRHNRKYERGIYYVIAYNGNKRAYFCGMTTPSPRSSMTAYMCHLSSFHYVFCLKDNLLKPELHQNIRLTARDRKTFYYHLVEFARQPSHVMDRSIRKQYGACGLRQKDRF